MKSLVNKRIIICGKGGSGKSSIAVLLGNELIKKKYKLILLDADASNPGGLFRLLTDRKKPPRPLIEFFGGRDKVTCPTDDPAGLKRLNGNLSIYESAIKLSEIPEKYSFKNKNLILFQIGKIQEACEGCDGPMSKVARDFIVRGDYVMLIDIEAGIEHFGRGVEKNVDAVLIVLDPTFESLLIAETVRLMASKMGNMKVRAVLNKIDSEKTDTIMKNSLKERGITYIGSIYYDKEIFRAGFEGRMISHCSAEERIAGILNEMENIF